MKPSLLENPFVPDKPRNPDDAELVGKFLGPKAEAAMRKVVPSPLRRGEGEVGNDFALSEEERRRSKEGQLARELPKLFAAAKETAEKIEKEDDRAHAIGDIVYAEAIIGNLAAARATIETIATSWKNYCYGHIAEAEARAGDFTAARASAEREQYEVSRARTLIKIAEAEVAARHDPTDTLALAKAAADEIRFEQDLDFRVEVLAGIATVEARAGLDPTATFAAATTTMEGIESKKFNGLYAIIEAQAALGNFAAVKALAKEAEVAQAPSHLLRIAEAEAAAGIDPAETLATAKTMAEKMTGDPSDQVGVFIKIVEVGAKLGHDFSALLARAKMVAGGIQDNWQRAWSFINIAEAEAGLGQDFTATLAPAREIAKGDAHEHPLSLFERIASFEATVGDISSAKVTAGKVGDVKGHDSALVSIAVAEAKTGDLAAAKATVESITDARPRVSAIIGIARALHHYLEKRKKAPEGEESADKREPQS